MTKKFTSHDKRVTLNLALHSACCSQNEPLMAALQKLPENEWDVYKLPQEAIEVLYAEFDDDLEEQIKAEFEADPAFLIDLGRDDAECPLCGHQHIRWLFNIQNLAGGSDVKCGSSCIITHGLSVKGTETAAHAKAALEAAIRKQIKKLKIEAWHKQAKFHSDQIDVLAEALKRVRYNTSYDWKLRNSAAWKLRDLRKLERFYDRNGWLNTKLRWAEWTRLVGFARKFDEQVREEVAYPVSFEVANGAPEVAQKIEKSTVVSVKIEAPKSKKLQTPVVVQMSLPFNDICRELLTAKLGA